MFHLKRLNYREIKVKDIRYDWMVRILQNIRYIFSRFSACGRRQAQRRRERETRAMDEGIPRLSVLRSTPASAGLKKAKKIAPVLQDRWQDTGASGKEGRSETNIS